MTDKSEQTAMTAEPKCLTLRGCDDSTIIRLEMSAAEEAFLRRIAAAIDAEDMHNEGSLSDCQPHMEIRDEPNGGWLHDDGDRRWDVQVPDASELAESVVSASPAEWASFPLIPATEDALDALPDDSKLLYINDLYANDGEVLHKQHGLLWKADDRFLSVGEFIDWPGRFALIYNSDEDFGDGVA